MAVKLAPKTMPTRGLATGTPLQGMTVRENLAWREQEHDPPDSWLTQVSKPASAVFAPKATGTTTDISIPPLAGEPIEIEVRCEADASLGLCAFPRGALTTYEDYPKQPVYVAHPVPDLTEQVEADLDETADMVLERGETPPTQAARPVVLDVARSIAELAADRMNIQVAAFADGEGGAELILDCFVTHRRLSIEISRTATGNVITIDEFAHLSSSPFDTSDRQRLEELIEWLTAIA